MYDVSGIQRVTTKRVSKKRDILGPAIEKEYRIDRKQYLEEPLDPKYPKGTGLLHSYEIQSISTKQHTAKLWISKEFPVALEDLLPIFAILSPNGKHFEKLKHFLSVPLPEEGFPVKIGKSHIHYYIISNIISFRNTSFPYNIWYCNLWCV